MISSDIYKRWVLTAAIVLVPAARAGRFVEQRLTWTPPVLSIEEVEPTGARAPIITESPWGTDSLLMGARAFGDHHVYDVEDAAGSQPGIGDYDLVAGVARRVAFDPPMYSPSTLEFDEATGLLLAVNDLGIPAPPNDLARTVQIVAIDPATGAVTLRGASFGINFWNVSTYDPLGRRLFLLHVIDASGPVGRIQESAIRAYDPDTGALLRSWPIPLGDGASCRHAEYDPVRDRVLIVHWDSGGPARLLALDLGTGEVSVVATFGDVVGSPGFGALDPEGRRFMISAETTSWTIDVDDGTILGEVPTVH